MSARQSQSRESFISLVDRVAALAEGKDISVGDVIASIGRRAYGPLLLAIGLFSISPATIAPGMTWLSAFLALVLSLQMALGAHHPWLPRRTLSAHLPRTAVRKATLIVRPWAARFDGLFKPRLTFLAEPPFVNLAGWVCVAAALATFPLGLIPMAPIAPGLAIALFGVGLTAKDGVLLSAAAALGAGVGWFIYILVA